MNTKTRRIDLVIVKTPDSIYITDDISKRTYHASDLGSLLFDDKKPKSTFHPHWFEVDRIPKKIEEEKSQPDINKRYELTDKSLQSDKIPLVIPRDEAEYQDGDWKPKYSRYRSLYEFKSDPQPKKNIEVEFSITKEIECGIIKNKEGFSYPILLDSGCSKIESNLTQDHINYHDLNRMLIPTIVIHHTPCFLTSEQSYNIVRQYVKDHIDSRYAHITSDYSFCFTVCKLIKPIDHMPYQIKTGDLSKRRPRSEYRSDRKVIIFETSPAGYDRYPIFPGFKGENLEDLKNNIETYLKDLMDEINRPYTECPHCEGLGVTLNYEEHFNQTAPKE